jgi:hypothetical protein
MAELGNSVVKGSLRVINGIHGDLEGSATKIKATAGTGKYYLVGTLGQNATDANSIAYEDANVFIDNGILSASRLQGTLDSSYLAGKIDTVSRIDDASIPWNKLANNGVSGSQVYYQAGTFYVQGNLNVSGTTTLTNANNLSVHDAMIELSARSSYSDAITKITGMIVRAISGSDSVSPFMGFAPASVIKSKTGYESYDRAIPAFIPNATYDTTTNDVVYAASDISELLSDLNLKGSIEAGTVSSDSDSSGIYLLRKDSAGILHVKVPWYSSTKLGMINAGNYKSATSAVSANPYINFFEGSTNADWKSSVRIVGSGVASVQSDASNNITISSTDYRVCTDEDDSGTIYLNGSATVAVSASAGSGKKLLANPNVYVSAGTLYSNKGITSTGNLNLSSASSILIGSNLVSSTNKTTYIENSTGYIYELGHRPFPSATVSANISFA